jgi:hypothetical protein
LKRRWLILIILVLLAAAAVYPFETTVVPEWKIRIIDETGTPFVGAKVVQQWDHYSLGIGGGEEKWADEAGYVVFPKRTARSSFLHRMLRTGWAALMKLAHGSTGIRATVWATTPRVSSDPLEYQEGKSLPQVIVLRR